MLLFFFFFLKGGFSYSLYSNGEKIKKSMVEISYRVFMTFQSLFYYFFHSIYYFRVVEWRNGSSSLHTVPIHISVSMEFCYNTLARRVSFGYTGVLEFIFVLFSAFWSCYTLHSLSSSFMNPVFLYNCFPYL